MARKQSNREKKARKEHKTASPARKKSLARIIKAEKAVRQSVVEGDNAHASAKDIRDAAKAARSAKGATRAEKLAAGAKMRAAADIMRGETEREKGEGTAYTGVTGKAAREERMLDPRTNWEKVNRKWLEEFGGDRDKFKAAFTKEGQLQRYNEMFPDEEKKKKKVVDEDLDLDLDLDTDLDTDLADTGFPFPGMERGVGFPKTSRGYRRSFPDVPEYGGDVAAQSLLGYTPSWAGRDSSDWGILDPRAYGPPQQVMPWMGPTGQAPLRLGKGDKQYRKVGEYNAQDEWVGPIKGSPVGSGSRVGQFDWLSRKGGLVPPMGTTAWKPTPYSGAEIANWQRFNQGLLAPPIEFGGQTANQLAQFGLGSSGLLDTNLMKAGKQTA